MLRGWVRKLRLDRQQPTAQEEGTSEKDLDTTSVTLLDPNVLECPICCKLLQIPKFQCDNGHIACSMCIEKIKKMRASCKLPIGYNRCRAMERVTEATRVPCTNAKYGCKEKVSYGNVPSHEKQCLFGPCSCQMSECNYTGSYGDLKNHVSVKHKKDLIPFVWETPLILNSTLSEKLTILKEETDGELIVVQRFDGWHGKFVNVSCIAPLAAVIGSFVCNLKVSALPSVMKQVLIVKHIQKVSNKEPREDFMLIPSYMLQGVLIMKICIIRPNARVIHV